jgi:hypothetical protein
MTGEYEKPVRVTISDPETGAELESCIVKNDYVLITAGNRYLKHAQIMGKTHVVSIAVRQPAQTDFDYSATVRP